MTLDENYMALSSGRGRFYPEYFISYYNNLFFNGCMELHVAENYYHALGCCVATCSFHNSKFLEAPSKPPPKGEALGGAY